MGFEVAICALASAALHPFRELVVKSDRNPEFTYFVIFAFTAALAGLHVSLGDASFLIPGRAWPLLLLAAGGELVYGVFAVAALRYGDLSIYYPILRSTAFGIVLIDFLVLGESYGVSLLLGISVTILGVFLIQWQRNVHPLENLRVLLFAFVAMFGTCVYSLTDARLMKIISPEVRLFWTVVLILPLLGMVALRQAKADGMRLGSFAADFSRIAVRCFLAAATSYASFYLLLKALTLGGNVAAVSAVRQASLPISVLLGSWMLGESAFVWRLLASLVLVGGIVLIIFG